VAPLLTVRVVGHRGQMLVPGRSEGGGAGVVAPPPSRGWIRILR
jgi:hypothetical protein